MWCGLLYPPWKWNTWSWLDGVRAKTEHLFAAFVEFEWLIIKIETQTTATCAETLTFNIVAAVWSVEKRNRSSASNNSSGNRHPWRWEEKNKTKNRMQSSQCFKWKSLTKSQKIQQNSFLIKIVQKHKQTKNKKKTMKFLGKMNGWVNDQQWFVQCSQMICEKLENEKQKMIFTCHHIIKNPKK